MNLGAFSVSLSVKSVEASKVFYEKIGFEIVGGDKKQNWLIMRNDDCTIGLFQGMFSENILTFNPGWDSQGNDLEEFEDIRMLYEHFHNQGIKIHNAENIDKDGIASFSIVDPDGNAILFDQHRETKKL